MVIKLISVLIWICYALAIEPGDYKITELKPGNETLLVEERHGQVDRHATFITFRDTIVEKKGLLAVVNEFDDFLRKKGINPETYYHIRDNRIAVWTTSLSDMMELKTTATKEKSVLEVKSGGEVRLGAYISNNEKDDYYRRITAKKKNKKSKIKKEENSVKTDL